jgi:arsenite methyltransferase
MLVFDASTRRILEEAYQGADIVRRRRAGFDALGAQPGDDVLDIGCGNGLLSLELARAVGEQGSVTAIDISRDMLDAARERCAHSARVRFLEAGAANIPVADGAADRAVSLQVFEYLSDIPGALREIARTLRPGGRLVIGDMHFDSWIWFSDDPGRMSRMMAAWDDHLAERCVPALLPALLRDAGFDVDAVHPVTFCDTVLRCDGIANMLLILIETYVKERGLVPDDEATAWAAEQRQLAEQGRFFFSLTHFLVTASKRAQI